MAIYARNGKPAIKGARLQGLGANRIIGDEPLCLLEGFIAANQRLSIATEDRLPLVLKRHNQVLYWYPPFTKATQKMQVKRAIASYRHAEPSRGDNT